MIKPKSLSTQDSITHEIIGAAIEVHRILGPGLLESAYSQALEHELTLKGFSIEREVQIPVEYKGKKLGTGYRADLIIDNKVLIELKAQEDNKRVFEAQTLTNLRLSGLKIGLLINFHNKKLVEGVKRFVF